MIKVYGRNVNCDECPIIKNLEERLKFSEKYGIEPQLEYCYCDKVQDKFLYGGQCGDASAEAEHISKVKPRKTGRAYRREMEEHKDNKRKSTFDYNTHGGYPAYRWKNGELVPMGYIKYAKNSKNERYWKNYSNRKIRRNKDELHDGNSYRKIFDYDWNVY